MEQEAKKPTNPRACCVKFDEGEWARITQERDAFRLSIPKLLKGVYFNRKVQSFLMSKPQEDRFIAQWEAVDKKVQELCVSLKPPMDERALRELQEIKRHLHELQGHFVQWHER